MIRVFGNVMITLIIGSQILKAFCAVFGICARKKLHPKDFSMNTASNSSVERCVVNGSNAMAKHPWVFIIIYYYYKLHTI